MFLSLDQPGHHSGNVMKNLAGALALYFVTSSAANCQTVDLSLYPGVSISHQLDDRISLQVFNGQMVYITDGLSRAIIEFTEFSNDAASYRFKALEEGASEVTFGTARVFEKYTRDERNDGSVDLKDGGSELFVVAGSLKVEWSYASQKSGFLYFSPSIIRLFVIDAKYFELVEFPAPGSGK